MNASPATSILACGDCAHILLVDGAELDAVTRVIGLSAVCEVHWTDARPQATNAILSRVHSKAGAAMAIKAKRAPVEVTPAPAAPPVDLAVLVASPKAPLPAPWAAPLAPASDGPLTTIATALLCAWSHGDGTKADALT